MNISLSNDDLTDLLEENYGEDFEDFFKIIRDNNLTFNLYSGYIADSHGNELYYVGVDSILVVQAFYKYWLKHIRLSKCSSNFNNGFIDLRC